MTFNIELKLGLALDICPQTRGTRGYCGAKKEERKKENCEPHNWSLLNDIN
jgi:hypothetical protein